MVSSSLQQQRKVRLLHGLEGTLACITLQAIGSRMTA